MKPKFRRYTSKKEGKLNYFETDLGNILYFFKLSPISAQDITRFSTEYEALDSRNKLEFGKFRKFKGDY